MISRQQQWISQRSSTETVVALGGGGARGLAHFGALQAIWESGLRVDRIVGTSIGALAGAVAATEPNIASATSRVRSYVLSDSFASKQASLCGAHPQTDRVYTPGLSGWYDRLRTFWWARRLLTRLFRRRSLLSASVLMEVIEALVPDIDIEDTEIPLSMVAVDLHSGLQVVLERGPLRRAVLASAAIPGVFPPVAWQDMLLCDVGVLDSLPTLVASHYRHDCLIGVDVGPGWERVEDLSSALHVWLRMDEIAERLNRRRAQAIADVLIRPTVGNRRWFDFAHPDQLIEAGLTAGRSALHRHHSMAS